MPKQLLVSVGKRHDADIAAGINEFTARLSREIETGWLLVKPSGADEPIARCTETDSLLALIKDDDFVVLLDERCRELDSPTLAEQYDAWLQRSQRIVFIVGGAYGVDDRLHDRADFVWSLSKLVFPHQIVRLLLAEQLYRARMISKNHPYHHT